MTSDFACLELTRDPAFINGSQDIFDVLARIMHKSAAQTLSEQEAHIHALEKTSDVDSFTGLLNRRGFIKVFTKEVARTNRDLSTGGLLVVFSLENLDSIEKNHGGEAVSRALRLVAKALENEIRDMDTVARTGVQEFVILFAETTMERALGRLQVMALRLNKLSVVWNGAEIHLSLSLGLKSYAKGANADLVFKGASADLQRNRAGCAQVKRA